MKIKLAQADLSWKMKSAYSSANICISMATKFWKGDDSFGGFEQRKISVCSHMYILYGSSNERKKTH